MEKILTDNDIRKIVLSFSNKDVLSVRQIYKSAWDIDDEYILKRCTDLNELNKSVWFSEYLTGKNIPVRTYLKAGKFYVEYGGENYCLMNKIKGSHMDPFAGNRFENGLLLGGIVADLHQVLAHAETPFKLYDANFMSELPGWITDEISKNNLSVGSEIMQACLDFEQLYSKLPRQIIHRDMHCLNLVFNGGEFAGYLDFDISQTNARILDLSYLGCSMLVGKYADEEMRCQWKEIFKGVLTGYHKKNPISDEEKEAIPTIFLLIELTFAAWYCRINEPEQAQSCVDMMNWCYTNLYEIKDTVVI